MVLARATPFFYNVFIGLVLTILLTLVLVSEFFDISHNPMQRKKTGLLCLFVGCFLLLHYNLSAQVSFSVPSDTISGSQETYSVPVTVRNFQKIIGAQFTLKWDKTILDFQSIDQLAFADLSLENHFNAQPDSGRINFLYLDLGLSGIDLPDDTVLFRVNFAVIGLPGSMSEQVFSNEPTEREVTDTSSINTSEPVPSEFNDGFVYIRQTTNTYNRQPDVALLQPARPNPFSVSPQVKYTIRKSGNYRLRLLSLGGQILWQQERYHTGGVYQEVLPADFFSTPGVYFFQLESEHTISTQKLIFSQ